MRGRRQALCFQRGNRTAQTQTGWSIKKFVRTARRYRSVRIKAGSQALTAVNRYPTTSAKPSS